MKMRAGKHSGRDSLVCHVKSLDPIPGWKGIIDGLEEWVTWPYLNVSSLWLFGKGCRAAKFLVWLLGLETKQKGKKEKQTKWNTDGPVKFELHIENTFFKCKSWPKCSTRETAKDSTYLRSKFNSRAFCLSAIGVSDSSQRDGDGQWTDGGGVQSGEELGKTRMCKHERGRCPTRQCPVGSVNHTLSLPPHSLWSGVLQKPVLELWELGTQPSPERWHSQFSSASCFVLHRDPHPLLDSGHLLGTGA